MEPCCMPGCERPATQTHFDLSDDVDCADFCDECAPRVCAEPHCDRRIMPPRTRCSRHRTSDT